MVCQDISDITADNACQIFVFRELEGKWHCAVKVIRSHFGRIEGKCLIVVGDPVRVVQKFIKPWQLTSQPPSLER